MYYGLGTIETIVRPVRPYKVLQKSHSDYPATLRYSQIGSFSLCKTTLYEYRSLENVHIGTLFAYIN